jgi:hypothetical protein
MIDDQRINNAGTERQRSLVPSFRRQQAHHASVAAILASAKAAHDQPRGGDCSWRLSHQKRAACKGGQWSWDLTGTEETRSRWHRHTNVLSSGTKYCVQRRIVTFMMGRWLKCRDNAFGPCGESCMVAY